MVHAYMNAQLLPTARGRPGGGGLLVLGSANVGEALRGVYRQSSQLLLYLFRLKSFFMSRKIIQVVFD